MCIRDSCLVLIVISLVGCASAQSDRQGEVNCSTPSHDVKTSDQPGLSVTYSALATLKVTSQETGEVLEPVSVTDKTVNGVPVHIASFLNIGSGHFNIDIKF